MTALADSWVSNAGEAVVPSWQALDAEPLQCVQIQRITHDVRSFVFEPLEPRVFRHDAGQYLVIGVTIDGTMVERCYTITSPPTRPSRVAITVKRVPDGVVSNWLHDNVKLGSIVSARGPFGAFSPSYHRADRYLLLSGGSGATPMMAALRTFFDLGVAVDVAYIHSARTPDDILFRQELAMMTSITPIRPKLSVTHVCEGDAPGEAWHGYRGRVDAAALRGLVPDIGDREIFACGPVPYLESIRNIVAALGVPNHRYHEESFVFPVVSAEPPAEQPDDAPGAAFTVEFKRSGRTVGCDAGMTLLDAATRSGISVPYACSQGICGTCKVLRVSGDVQMSHQGGISPREIAAGHVLLCCSEPESDIVVDA